MTNLFFKLILTFSCITAVLAEEEHHQQMTNAQVWGFAILAGAGLSSIGFLAALIVVCLRKVIQDRTFKIIVNLLYALGCGAMVGDVMIHILPESYKNEQANFRFVALIFIGAIVAFLAIQRLFVSCGVAHQHWGEEDQQHGHKHHEHQHQPKNGQNQPRKEMNLQSNLNSSLQVNSPRKIENKSKETNQLKILSSNKVIPVVDIDELKKQSQNYVEIKIDSNADVQNEEQNKKGQGKDQGCLSSYRGKGSAGYLNLLSSFIHNFLDGFAIGAAFASRERDTYVPVIIAVYAHQIPREMGDVGILLKNKFNAMQTIFCNGVINLISLIGVIIGIALGKISQSVQIYLLTFVAGNFIYIGADIWRNLLKNKTSVANIIQFLFFALGVGSMYLVLLAETGGAGHQH